MDEMERSDTRLRERRFRYRGGVFFPLVLIALGIVFLLQNMSFLPGDTWELIWRLWPLLLVIAGIDSLLKRDGVAGPAFLVGLGMVFLLSNFNLLTWNVWELILRLWPVLLIAWGLDLVLGRRNIWGAALALLILVGVMAGAILMVGVGTPMTEEKISWVPETMASEIQATLRPGVASLKIGALPQGATLLEGRLLITQSERLDKDFSLEEGIGKVSLSTTGLKMVYPAGQLRGPQWELNFTTLLPLGLGVEVGVGNADLDLRSFQLSKLALKMGVGQMKVYLPAQDLRVRIEGGVGQTIIYLPAGVAVKLNDDSGLASVSVPPGFTHHGDFYSLAGDAGDPLLEIDMDQGIGSLVVKFAP